MFRFTGHEEIVKVDEATAGRVDLFACRLLVQACPSRKQWRIPAVSYTELIAPARNNRAVSGSDQATWSVASVEGDLVGENKGLRIETCRLAERPLQWRAIP